MLKKYKSRHGARAPSGAKYHGRTGGQKVKMDLTRQWTYRCTSNNSNPILIDLMANVKLRMSRHRDQKTLNRSLQYILYASGFLALSSLLANHTSLSLPPNSSSTPTPQRSAYCLKYHLHLKLMYVLSRKPRKDVHKYPFRSYLSMDICTYILSRFSAL